MGIYTNGKIYGIRWGDESVEYEKISGTELTSLQLQQIKNDYNNLPLERKNRVIVSQYTKCSTTYNVNDPETMLWFPLEKSWFE